MDRRFYLYKRRNGFYYAELIIDGQRIIRSTKETNKNKAAIIAAGWIAGGIPDAQGKKSLSAIADFKSLMDFIQSGDINEAQAVDINRELYKRGLINNLPIRASLSRRGLIEFLLEYWNYDNSPAMKDKRAHGKQVLKDTCYSASNVIKNKWQPYFKDKTLGETARSDLKEFGLYLKETGLAGKTVNNLLYFGCIALKWAYNEKLIPENITEGLSGFVGGGKPRDILTDEEMQKLVNYEYWQSKRGYAGFMLASTSGLRNSEMRALKREHIGEYDGKPILYVKYSHNNRDGIKNTKNGEERTVYLLPEVRGLLLDLLNDNPYSDRQFIFYNDLHADKPCDISLFPENLKIAMNNAGIEPAGRRIDCHSLRHYCGKKWDEATGDIKKVSKVLGHKTLAMSAHYANHTSEKEIADMGDQASKILQFRHGA